MSKSSKKQFAITAELLGRTMHQLDELGVPYALVLQGIPKMFSNVDQAHARAILDRQWRLNEKVMELEVETDAEKVTAIPPENDGGLKER
jgi:hypothetical protein